MTIVADRGRLTLKLARLTGIELVFDVFDDGFAIAAWCCSDTGVVIGFGPVARLSLAPSIRLRLSRSSRLELRAHHAAWASGPDARRVRLSVPMNFLVVGSYSIARGIGVLSSCALISKWPYSPRRR